MIVRSPLLPAATVLSEHREPPCSISAALSEAKLVFTKRGSSRIKAVPPYDAQPRRKPLQS